MKTLRKRFPILVSIVLTVLFPLIALSAARPLAAFGDFFADNLYLAQLLVEILSFAVFLILALLMGLGFIFRRSRKPIRALLVPCTAILAIYSITLLGNLALSLDYPMQPPLKILWFLLCMLSVGLTEELIFRGMITRMLYAKYGRNPVGVWFSVLLSGLLFGLMHLSNAYGGVIDLKSVLVQVVGACMLGTCLGAIYLRTGSYWTVALLHAFMDFCGLFSSGVFTMDSMTDTLGSYSAVNLVSVIPYLAIGLVLLRPSKMRTITDGNAQPSQGQIIGLMIAVMLIAGLISAVTVLSV
ncbi:MAG: CPBP family intramembrane metalloprotease [Oscillospiraceae bacterium]|nr:CPBP family intramembrane metalloprotease [Oscillospiraceae bacterium]